MQIHEQILHTKCTSMKREFQTTDVHQSSLCHKDLTLSHFVVSSTNVKRARVMNWESVCIVLYCVVGFNMSKAIPNKEHLRTALIFCFHLKKTAAESYRSLRAARCEICVNDSFGVSIVVT